MLLWQGLSPFVRSLHLLHPTHPLIMVTGPARSGKSEWAESLAASSGQQVIYVATAAINPKDEEWCDRIQQHRQRRPPDWQTLESPDDLGLCIQQATEQDCLLVDSIGTWLAPLLEQPPSEWAACCERLLSCLEQRTCTVIFVVEETGWGVVPAYPIGRTFRDRLGEIGRRLGRIADVVYLVTAGHVLNLSALGHPLPTTETSQI